MSDCQLQLTPEPVPLPEVNVIEEAWYTCLACKVAERIWGNSRPETDYKPLLNCSGCGRPTRHEFRAMDTGQWRDYASQLAQGRA